MKIKYKFLIGISLIVLLCGLALNISIRVVLIKNMEASVTLDLKQLMYTTRQSIKYRLTSDELGVGEGTLENQGSYLTRNISSTFQCTVQLQSYTGQILSDNTKEDFKGVLEKGTLAAKEGNAVVNLRYSGREFYGILSYPIYINGKNFGILNLVKDFTDSYDNIRSIIILITVLEAVIFISILIFAYFLISRITKPIIKLTKGVKEVGHGDYSFSMDIKGEDEISVLLKEFINMKEMIKNQIRTIKEEKEKVENLVKGRKNFFDNVTHEMKTPLTAISGYAEMLLEERVEDEDFNKRALQRIYLESERLHSLIIDLIKVSKGLSYTKEDMKEIQLKALVEEICGDMTIKGRKYGIDILTKVEEGNILGQENRIREVIINIIDNGIKYSREGTTIEVKGKASGDRYLLQVETLSGVIPRSIYENIFEPFVKSDKFTESESRGLGLYLSSEIMKDHGGTIEIINGERVKVQITLPLNK